ncbi:MAG TPA: hypothetical protein VKJ65_08645 [Phycisphaerae bacterium]|nr:hypothetical protein [Phycisphaerae bacterium]
MFEDPRSRLRLRPKQSRLVVQDVPEKSTPAPVPEKPAKKQNLQSTIEDQRKKTSFAGKFVLWVCVATGTYSLGIVLFMSAIILGYQRLAGQINIDAFLYLAIFAGLPSLFWTNVVWYSFINPDSATQTRDQRIIETLRYFRISGAILLTVLTALGLAFLCALIDMFNNQRTIDIYIIILSIPAALHCVCIFILWRPALAGGALVQRWREEDEKAQ